MNAQRDVGCSMDVAQADPVPAIGILRTAGGDFRLGLRIHVRPLVEFLDHLQGPVLAGNIVAQLNALATDRNPSGLAITPTPRVRRMEFAAAMNATKTRSHRKVGL